MAHLDERGNTKATSNIPSETLEILNNKPKTPLQKGFFDAEEQRVEYTYNSDIKMKIMDRYHKLLGLTEPEKEEPEEIQILSDNDDLEQMLRDELARREADKERRATREEEKITTTTLGVKTSPFPNYFKYYFVGLILLIFFCHFFLLITKLTPVNASLIFCEEIRVNVYLRVVS